MGCGVGSLVLCELPRVATRGFEMGGRSGVRLACVLGRLNAYKKDTLAGAFIWLLRQAIGAGEYRLLTGRRPGGQGTWPLCS